MAKELGVLRIDQWVLGIVFCLGVAPLGNLQGQQRSQATRPVIQPDSQQSRPWLSKELEQEAQAHAKILWSKILTHCGDSYYYVGSGLDNLTSNGRPLKFSNGAGSNIAEYRGVIFSVIPSAVPPPAGQLIAAGAEDMGSAVMMATTFRSGNTTTLEWDKTWMNGPLQKVDRQTLLTSSAARGAIAFNVLGQVTGFVGMSGSIVVQMTKKEGKWYYNLSGISGYFSRSEEELMDSDDTQGSPHQTEYMGRDAQGAFVIKSHGAKITTFYCGMMPYADAAGNVVRSPSAFEAANRPTAEKTSRKYEGSADGLIAKIQSLLQQATAANGLSVSFDQEASAIADAVRVCAGITPRMASSVGVEDFAGTVIEPIQRLGRQYGVCMGLTPVATLIRKSDPNSALGLGMSIAPRGLWRDGNGFTVSVEFTGINATRFTTEQRLAFFAIVRPAK